MFLLPVIYSTLTLSLWSLISFWFFSCLLKRNDCLSHNGCSRIAKTNLNNKKINFNFRWILCHYSQSNRGRMDGINERMALHINTYQSYNYIIKCSFGFLLICQTCEACCTLLVFYWFHCTLYLKPDVERCKVRNLFVLKVVWRVLASGSFCIFT